MASISHLSRFVVTGPSGWIGRSLLAHLERTMGSAFQRQVTAFASTAREQRLASGTNLAVRALETIVPADLEGAHLVHLAYLTKEKVDELGEQRFIETNLAIDQAVLDAMSRAAPASIFVASSGAAALAASGRDLHPYGLAKLGQEARFLKAGRSAQAPVIAGRIFNLAGPNINKLASYAISNFVQQARETGRIRIEADIPVFRSYLHVENLCALIVEAARQGLGIPEPLDLCGSEVVEMRDLASAVARAVGGGISIERKPVDCSRPSVYLGDCTDTKVLAMRLDTELADFEQQVLDTARWVGMQYPCDINKFA